MTLPAREKVAFTFEEGDPPGARKSGQKKWPERDREVRKMRISKRAADIVAGDVIVLSEALYMVERARRMPTGGVRLYLCVGGDADGRYYPAGELLTVALPE